MAELPADHLQIVYRVSRQNSLVRTSCVLHASIRYRRSRIEARLKLVMIKNCHQHLNLLRFETLFLSLRSKADTSCPNTVMVL